MDRNDPLLRAFALIAFVAVLAGATAVAYQAIQIEGLPVDVNSVVARRTTGPGMDVAYPVTVASTTGTTQRLNVSVKAPAGVTADAPDVIRAPPGNGTGFWVEASVAEDPRLGDHTVQLRLSSGNTTRVVGLPLTVEDPRKVVQRGDTARVKYVGRYPNGSVFATNVRAVDKSAIPKAPRYSSPSYNPITVPTGPNATFISGFKKGIVGVGIGHDVSLHLEPGEAYGNETVRVTRPRTENISRFITEPRVFNLSRRSLAQQGFVNQSSEEGDRITLGQPPRVRVYRITFLNDTRVRLILEVEEGDRQTHHPQWPNSSVAVKVNDTHVRYRVDPPYQVGGEAFTWHDYWPNATVVARIGNENITLRHTPEVGSTYNKSVQGKTLKHTVVAVTEDAIVARRPNPAPLAGQTVIFDVTVLKVTGD